MGQVGLVMSAWINCCTWNQRGRNISIKNDSSIGFHFPFIAKLFNF